MSIVPPATTHRRAVPFGRDRTLSGALGGLLPFVFTAAAQAGIPIPENPRWVAVADDVYLQEVGRKVPTDTPILSAAVVDGTLYCGHAGGLWRLNAGRLVDAGGPRGPVRRLKAIDGDLWAMTDAGLWRMTNNEWKQVDAAAFVDLTAHLGAVVVASSTHLYRVEGDRLVSHCEARRASPILGVASYCETLYVRLANGVGLLQHGRIEYDDVKDFGTFPLGATTRDNLALGGRLLVATDRGLAVLRGMTWWTLRGKDGLCYEDTTCLAAGFDNDYWVGTARGAIRVVDGDFHFFGYERWLPHDRVNAIACGDRVAYIATDGGLGIIGYEPYTLRKKAAWYERWLEESGQKRLGLVHTLMWRPDRKEYVRFLSDNDLGWALHRLDGLCFQYAVTKDPAVRREAVDVFRTVKWSEEITPIDGYPARAVYAVGENAIKATTGSAGMPAEWNLTADGKWEWKGDTSSDEVIAQLYTVSIFRELVAQGKEKAAAEEHLHGIVKHIKDRGWVLRDLDNKPTRWGRWDPAFLQGPEGYNERGLNSLQALAMVVTASALTGDEQFEAGKRQLLEWGYHTDTLRQKRVFPEATFFDDRLAFLAYYPLLRYEADPVLRSIFRRSLERSWEIKRLENMPWFSYIYGGLTGNECENERAARHLREWPLDCINYRYTNSHRHDLHVPTGYRNYVDDWKPMTPRDIGPQRWDRDFYALDGGGDRRVLDPSGWLDAYWMARYYGFISAPTTTEEDLLTVNERTIDRGAAPYKGPPRPDLFDF